MKYFTLVFAIGMAALAACSQKNEKEAAILQEARQFHKVAFALHDSAMKELGLIRELQSRLKSKKDSLLATQDTAQGKVIDLALVEFSKAEDEMSVWMQNVVEVEGDEHGHHHGHDHKHSHETPISLTAEETLAIQKEMQSSMQELYDKIKALKVRLQSL